MSTDHVVCAMAGGTEVLDPEILKAFPFFAGLSEGLPEVEAGGLSHAFAPWKVKWLALGLGASPLSGGSGVQNG